MSLIFVCVCVFTTESNIQFRKLYLETTFIASNMNTSGLQSGAKPDRSLSRAEFMEAVIRMGIQKFYSDGKRRSAEPTTGSAVMRLILEHLVPLKNNQSGMQVSTPICDANELRDKVLYTMQIDDVFRKEDRIEILRLIFNGACSQKHNTKGGSGGGGGGGCRMSVAEV